MSEKEMIGMVDLHSHIVPGVDDGAQTKSQVRQMLRKEYEDGVRTLVLTPHYRKGMFESETELVRKRAAYVIQESKNLGLDMQIYLGREYHANSDMITELKQNPYYRINQGKYVLVEFSSAHSFEKIRNWIYQMVVAGFRPVIAHIERYPDVMKDLARVEELVELGGLVQISTSAILGDHGFRLKGYTKKLLQKRLVHFVASDAHDMEDRQPNMEVCYQYVAKKYGEDYARELFVTNPEKILKTVD